jgi:hypothetical protein
MHHTLEIIYRKRDSKRPKTRLGKILGKKKESISDIPFRTKLAFTSSCRMGFKS